LLALAEGGGVGVKKKKNEIIRSGGELRSPQKRATGIDPVRVSKYVPVDVNFGEFSVFHISKNNDLLVFNHEYSAPPPSF